MNKKRTIRTLVMVYALSMIASSPLLGGGQSSKMGDPGKPAAPKLTAQEKAAEKRNHQRGLALAAGMRKEREMRAEMRAERDRMINMHAVAPAKRTAAKKTSKKATAAVAPAPRHYSHSPEVVRFEGPASAALAAPVTRAAREGAGLRHSQAAAARRAAKAREHALSSILVTPPVQHPGLRITINDSEEEANIQFNRAIAKDDKQREKDAKRKRDAESPRTLRKQEETKLSWELNKQALRMQMERQKQKRRLR